MATTLSEQDLGMLQSCIDSIMQRVAELGLALVVEQDFASLNRFLAARGGFVNPSFDPLRSRLGWRDFWVQLLDPGGKGIGCSAERVIDTEDLAELVATGRIWYAKGFAAVGGPERSSSGRCHGVLPAGSATPGRPGSIPSGVVRVWRCCWPG